MRQKALKATIILPEDAPSVKVEGIKAFSADVILHGFTSPEGLRSWEEERKKDIPLSIPLMTLKLWQARHYRV